MTAIQSLILITAGYLFGVYSMSLASKQQLKQANAMKAQAAIEVRRAGKLYWLTMKALSSGVVPRNWEAELDDDKGKTDQTSL